MADELPQTTSCPRCGEAVEEAQSVCPNCGAFLKGVWPPPPEGAATPSSPTRPKTLTGRVWTDFLLGAAAQYLTHLATVRVLVQSTAFSTSNSETTNAYMTANLVTAELFWGFVLGLLLYFGARWLYPSVARGSGYATLALLTILLGALWTCHPVLY